MEISILHFSSELQTEEKSEIDFKINSSILKSLQCFDAVGWAASRASSL